MVDQVLLEAGLVLAALIGGGVAVHERVLRQRRLRQWQCVELRFSREVSAGGVVSVLETIAALGRGVSVVLKVRCDGEGIRHYAESDRATLDTLVPQLGAVLPGIRTLSSSGQPVTGPAFGARIATSRSDALLRSDEVEAAAAGLLASLAPLGKGEVVAVRWVVEPARRHSPTSRAGAQLPAEQRRLLERKAHSPLLAANGTVLVNTGQVGRAHHLIRRVGTVLRTRATTLGRLRLVALRGASRGRAASQRSVHRGLRLSPAELAGLIGWPVGSPALPGLTMGTAPALLVPASLPERGRVLGIGTHPASTRPVAQPLSGVTLHTLIAGPSGVGKSTVLAALAAQDVAAGRGLVLIDAGKGDTAEMMLAQIPDRRLGDVIVLDCGWEGPLPGLKLFAGDDLVLAADVALSVLADIFHDSWGVLSEKFLRAALVAVAHDPESTIADLPFVYRDDNYRRKLAAGVGDDITRGVLLSVDQMDRPERDQQLGSTFNKLGALLGRPAVKTVLGQPDGALDLDRVLGDQQIVVVSLAPVRIGSGAARLIAALILHRLFGAVLGRGRLPESKRQLFSVYLDEPGMLADTRLPVDGLLEMARGMGVGVTLAPQSLTQLDLELRRAVLTNVGTRIVFAQHDSDARLLARDLPGVAPEDLTLLDRFEVIARIAMGPGENAPPVSLRTLPSAPAISDPVAVRRHAAGLGRTPAEVEQALRERHRPTTPPPIGRSRRSS